MVEKEAEKLKANRATEEQRRERLRIRRKKGRARRRTKKQKKKVVRNRRPRETAPSHSQRLKRGDKNELERNLRREGCR